MGEESCAPSPVYSVSLLRDPPVSCSVDKSPSSPPHTIREEIALPQYNKTLPINTVIACQFVLSLVQL